jgi:hypothetical protein
MISFTETMSVDGVACEWEVREDGRKLGKILQDSEGTFYAQAPNADYQMFETGGSDAAIEWLKSR